MDNLKITGTKCYVDIEFKGNIARFNGELCVNSFAATLNSGHWLKHTGNACREDINELISEVDKYNKNHIKEFQVHFFDDYGNRCI